MPTSLIELDNGGSQRWSLGKRKVRLLGLSLAPFAGILCLLCSTPMYGQQELAVPTTGPLLGRLVESAEDSRWLWGTFRVQPSFGISGLSYVDDVFVDNGSNAEPTSDLTSTAFAGIDIYQLLGERVAFGFSVRPSYSWWQDLEERRRFNLQVGAAAAAELNRYFLDSEVRSTEAQRVVTEEAEQLINSRVENLRVRTGFKIYRSLALAAGFDRLKTENLLDESPSALIPDFERLHATTETRIAGLRATFWGETRVLLGYAETETESASTGRDFEGDGLILEITAGRPTLTANVILRQFEYRPAGNSTFLPYDRLGGRVSLRLGTARGRSLSFYGDRGLLASVRQGETDFVSTRYGVSSSTPLTDRMSLVVDYSDGDRDFRSSLRDDDFRNYGVGLQIRLLERTTLFARYKKSELDSNVETFDRDFSQFTINFSVGIAGLSWP